MSWECVASRPLNPHLSERFQTKHLVINSLAVRRINNRFRVCLLNFLSHDTNVLRRGRVVCFVAELVDVVTVEFTNLEDVLFQSAVRRTCNRSGCLRSLNTGTKPPVSMPR